MKEKIYDLIENEDGTLTAVIKEGVTHLEENPFMPKLFERNENVTVLAVPSTLESVYIDFQNRFPNLKKIGSMGNNPNWRNFSFKYGLFKSSDQPREDLPYLIPNGDGTLTLDIPEGVRDMSDIGIFTTK